MVVNEKGQAATMGNPERRNEWEAMNSFEDL